MRQSFDISGQTTFAEHMLLGRRFRVARWMKPDKPGHPLLFFTGIGANIELLAPFLRTLDREVITLDMPGLGESEEWSGPYRLKTMAKAAKQLISSFDHNEIDVMGVSWGGMLAQEFAYRNPRLVRRLVLAATSPGLPVIPGSLATLLRMVSSHRYSELGSITPYLRTLYGGTSDGLDGYAAAIRRPSSIGYLHQILAIVGWTSVRKLTRVRAGTLIMMGDDDRLVPAANGYILRFVLSDAQLEILKDAGHLLLLTHRAKAAEMVDSFLDGIGSSTAPQRSTGPVCMAK